MAAELQPQNDESQKVVSLQEIVRRAVQKTYADLQNLAEVLFSRSVLERKLALLDFALNTRRLFVRLLVLVKWASQADNVQLCQRITQFLRQQDTYFREAAEHLCLMQDSLLRARTPQYDVLSAVDVLVTGSFPQLPAALDTYKSAHVATPEEERELIERVNNILRMRIITSILPSSLIHVSTENGLAVFRVDNEFEISLFLSGDSPSLSWRIRSLKILVASQIDTIFKLNKEMDENQIQHLIGIITMYMNLPTTTNPFIEMYNHLHSFVLSIVLEMMYFQVQYLNNGRWGNRLRSDYKPRSYLRVHFWSAVHARPAASASSSTTKPPLAPSTAAPAVGGQGQPTSSPGPPSPYCLTILLDENELPQRMNILQSTGGAAVQPSGIEGTQTQGNPAAAAAAAVQLVPLLATVNFSQVSIEALLTAAVEKQTQEVLEHLRRSLLMPPGSGSRFTEDEVTIETQNTTNQLLHSTTSLSVRFYASRCVHITVDPRTGMLQLSLSGGEASSLSKKLREVETRLNKNTEPAVDVLLALRYETIFDHLEMIARRLDLEPFRKIPLEPTDVTPPELQGHYIFFRFASSPSFYLLVTISDNYEYSYHLVGTRISSPNSYQLKIESMSLHQSSHLKTVSTGFLERVDDHSDASKVNQLFEDGADTKPSLKRKLIAALSTDSKPIKMLKLQNKNNFTPLEESHLEKLAEVVAFFRLRIALLKIGQQLKAKNVQCWPVPNLFGMTGMQSIIRLQTLPGDLPAVFRDKLLDLPNDSSLACRLILYVNTNLLPPFKLASMKDGQRISIDMAAQTVTVLFRKLNQAAAEILHDCLKLFKIAALAQQLTPHLDEQGKVLIGQTQFHVQYNLTDIHVHYHALGELCNLVLSFEPNEEGTNGRYRCECSSGGEHHRIEFFLESFINHHAKMHDLLEVLDRTVDMLHAIYSVQGVTVRPRSVAQIRIVFPLKHSLDIHAISRDTVAVSDSIICIADPTMSYQRLSYRRIPILKDFIMSAAMRGILGPGDPSSITCMDKPKVWYDFSSTLRTSSVQALLEAMKSYLAFVDSYEWMESIVKSFFAENASVSTKRSDLTLRFTAKRLDCVLFPVDFNSVGIRITQRNQNLTKEDVQFELNEADLSDFCNFFSQRMSASSPVAVSTFKSLLTLLRLHPLVLEDCIKLIRLTQKPTQQGRVLNWPMVVPLNAPAHLPAYGEPAVRYDVANDVLKFLLRLTDASGVVCDLPISFNIRVNSIEAWEPAQLDTQADDVVLSTNEIMLRMAQRDSTTPLGQTLSRLSVGVNPSVRHLMSAIIASLIEQPLQAMTTSSM